MIPLICTPLSLSQTHQSIEQYSSVLKGTQILSGTAQKQFLLCTVFSSLALVQPMQSLDSLQQIADLI